MKLVDASKTTTPSSTDALNNTCKIMKSMMTNTRHSRNHSRKNEETEEKPQVARHVKYKKGYHWTTIWGHKSTIGVSQQGYVNLDGLFIPRSILVYVSGLN